MTSSLTGLVCRSLYQSLHSMNASSAFNEKELFFPDAVRKLQISKHNRITVSQLEVAESSNLATKTLATLLKNRVGIAAANCNASEFRERKNQPEVFLHQVFLRPPRVMDVRAFGSRTSAQELYFPAL